MRKGPAECGAGLAARHPPREAALHNPRLGRLPRVRSLLAVDVIGPGSGLWRRARLRAGGAAADPYFAAGGNHLGLKNENNNNNELEKRGEGEGRLKRGRGSEGHVWLPPTDTPI